MTDPLSATLRYHLGWGYALWPGDYWESVLSIYGHELGNELLGRSYGLLSEIDALHIDWSAQTYVSGEELLKHRMQIGYPELDRGAFAALSWAFNLSQVEPYVAIATPSPGPAKAAIECVRISQA